MQTKRLKADRKLKACLYMLVQAETVTPLEEADALAADAPEQKPCCTQNET
jgi:hypothetical protein